jgi:hypothetical protein
LVLLLAAGVAGSAAPGSAQEVNFAGKTVRMILGQASGGGADTSARLIAAFLGKYLPGSPVSSSSTCRERMESSRTIISFIKSLRMARRYFDDPGWSQLAWGRHYFEEERKLLGAGPWPIGVKANLRNLERFIEYSFDQGLVSKRMTVESLFPEQVLDT